MLGIFKIHLYEPIQKRSISHNSFQNLYAKGRALEDENIDLTKKGFFSMLRIAYKRFGTDLIKNTPLVLTLPNGKNIGAKTDNQGYYLVDQNVDDLFP